MISLSKVSWAPFSFMCFRKLLRKIDGETCFLMPASRAASLIMRNTSRSETGSLNLFKSSFESAGREFSCICSAI